MRTIYNYHLRMHVIIKMKTLNTMVTNPMKPITDVSLDYDSDNIKNFLDKSTYFRNSPEEAIFDSLDEYDTTKQRIHVIEHSGRYYRCLVKKELLHIKMNTLLSDSITKKIVTLMT